ncbi:10886_t:CDS:1, partial [Ambispora gerdemannii]
AMQINEPPSLTYNLPQELIKIDEPPSLTIEILTAIYNDQDFTNNFMTDIYNQQDFTTAIHNQQGYTNNFTPAIANQNYTTNDLAQNSIDMFNQTGFFTENNESCNINNDNISSTLNSLITNTPITPPASQSQSTSFSQLFMTKYDLCQF